MFPAVPFRPYNSTENNTVTRKMNPASAMIPRFSAWVDRVYREINIDIDIVSTSQIYWESPDLLQGLYIFRKPDEVDVFLDRHTYLVPLLLEARVMINKYFPSSQVFLEVFHDPESLNAEQLTAAVCVETTADDAFDNLDRFDSDWWINAVRRAKGKLCINVEFV